MFHQSAGRSQRPKGFKVKHVFQVSLLLAICIWLLYQVKQSHDKRKDYGATVEKKIMKEYQSIDFGRKGNAGSSDGVETISDDRNPMEEGQKKNNRGDRDDELDRNAEEKAEQESVHEGREDPPESFQKKEGDSKKEAEMQEEESEGVGEDSTDNQVSDGHEVVGSDKDEKYSEVSAEENVTNDEDTREPSRQESEALGGDKDNFATLQINSDEKIDLEKDEKDSNVSEEENVINDEKKEDEMGTNRQVKESQGSEKDHLDTQLRDEDVAISSDKDKKDFQSTEEENVTNDEEKGDDKDPDTEQKESQGNKRDHFDSQLRDGDEAVGSNKDEKDSKHLAEEYVTNGESKGDDKEQNRKQKESQGIEKVKFDMQQKDGDKATASDRYQDSKADANKTELPSHETEKTSVPDQSETENGGEGFQDVNGVPQDGPELVNSTPNDKIGDEQTPSLDQETILGSDNQAGLGENTTLVTEEVDKSSQFNGSNDVEMRQMPSDDQFIVVKQDEGGSSLVEETAKKSSLVGANAESNSDGETVSESVDHIKSNINKTSETSKEDSIVSEDSTSAASQNEKEADSLKTLSQD